MENVYKRKKQLPIAGIIYIGQTLVGFTMGWRVPIMFILRDLKESPIADRITDTTEIWINSFLYVGYIIGPYFTGYFSNIVGRKPCLLVGGIITALSFILVPFTHNLTMIYAVRILQGFGIGIIAVGNIVYLGEIASTNIRGVLLTTIGTASHLGTLVIYVISQYVSFAGLGWVGLLLSLIFIGAGFFIPETPIFFVIKENEEEAKRILINLGRVDEVDEILATKQEIEDKAKTADWRELFTVKSNRRALSMLLTLGVFQQLSCVNVMIFYTSYIFGFAGLYVPLHLAGIIVEVTLLNSCCLTSKLVDSFGRKKLLLISTPICCLSWVALGGYFFCYEWGYADVYTVGVLPPTTLITFLVFYNLGLGIIPSTLTGEMFNLNVRSIGTTVTLTMTWLIGFGVSSAFGHIYISIYFKFWFFATACACAAVFTAFYVPETKGKSLLEIQEILGRNRQ